MNKQINTTNCFGYNVFKGSATAGLKQVMPVQSTSPGGEPGLEVTPLSRKFKELKENPGHSQVLNLIEYMILLRRKCHSQTFTEFKGSYMFFKQIYLDRILIFYDKYPAQIKSEIVVNRCHIVLHSALKPTCHQ